ncbi:hypothetical protein KC19_3G194500 [Ceratodon purpureus]|uniref:serine C-palmitoyltransferase n=1 Tax=Ceratodon purpureus TaxID=3225 RepID=A0A8T0IKB4_CERPU|nr:hypothetical protein KC19_3G194500 [Ceratodon purpureus]
MASTMLLDLKDSVMAFLPDVPLTDAVIFGIHIHGHLLLETLLVVVICYLLLQQSYTPENRALTETEIDQLCEEWNPEALHPPITDDMEMSTPVLESAAGPHTIVDGKDVINMSTADYLGLVGNPKVKEACNAAVEKYGVGACGPRGFYGTMDVHLDFEKKIADFMGTQDSILYSYGLATTTSVIPAFCKAGDLIIADDGVNWSLQNGLYLSRSKIKFFKHNDMKDLKAILEEVRKEDKRKKKPLNRRFIVVEAIYQNSGQMVPLDELVRLKEEYKFRVLVDESNTLGVLGKTGRGISEHFNIPVETLEIITAVMGHALASEGGICTGSAEVVSHQRLSGSGYCFSAALPPFLASAGIAAVEILEDNPQLLTRLHRNISIVHSKLATIPGISVGGDKLSPVIFLHLQKSISFAEDSSVLQRIVDLMLDEGVLLSVTKRSLLDNCKLPAALKVTVTAGHTEGDLLLVTSKLRDVIEKVLR